MKKLILSLLLLSTPAWATWSVRTFTSHACVAGASCAMTIPSTTAGDLIVVMAYIGNATDKVTSVTDNGGSSYSLCATSSCYATDSSANGVDAAYCLSVVGGATSVTVNKTSSSNALTLYVLQASHAGTAALDAVGTRLQTTNTTSPLGVALTLTGTNDVIVQGIHSASPTVLSGCYTSGGGTGNLLWQQCTNTTDGTAPTWTTSNSKAQMNALAFTEVSSGTTRVLRHRTAIF